jgi:hypothetical protein
LQRSERFLVAMERDYVTILRAELAACMNGRWGLFGQNDAVDRSSWPRSRGAAELLERGAEIDELRTYLGFAPYALHQRYLDLRAIRHSNAPGEPKLARVLFAELPADGESREAASG